MYLFITPAGSNTLREQPVKERMIARCDVATDFTALYYKAFSAVLSAKNFTVLHEKEHCAPPCLYERRADARRTRGRAMQTARTARNGTKKAVSTLCRLWKTAFYFCFCVTVKRFCGFSPCLCPFSATQNCAVCFHRRKTGVYSIVYRRKAMPLTVFAAAALKA